MNLKRIALLVVFVFSTIYIQAQLNHTDQNGLKQGPWIRKYPDGTKMYEGVFRNNHPVGEFKRYYENGKLKSILVFSEDGKQAEAVLYHSNGLIASKGRYVDQKKEGKWQFFSADDEGYLICVQTFTADIRNGLSLGFYRDSTIGDRTNYLNDVKNGKWEQFYQSGAPYIRSAYSGGKLNGPFEAWFENGNKMYSGSYRNDLRDGSWVIYNEDGSVRYRIQYSNGVPDNRQMDIDASKYIDNLEKQKGKIPDPEKTGEMW